MLGAPPAFILSQDRTLRSNARRREPPYSVSGRSVPSIDPADLGFAEIDVSDVASEFEISLVCHVDLSIAVSGSQGTPAQVGGVGLVAARGITIRAPPPRARENPGLHGFCTNGTLHSPWGSDAPRRLVDIFAVKLGHLEIIENTACAQPTSGNQGPSPHAITRRRGITGLLRARPTSVRESAAFSTHDDLRCEKGPYFGAIQREGRHFLDASSSLDEKTGESGTARARTRG